MQAQTVSRPLFWVEKQVVAVNASNSGHTADL